MRQFGLTGGIGTGKSTVSSLLAQRGAVIVDADKIVRALQTPGEQVFDMMVDRWGSGIVAEDGRLDRAGVAAIVFNNDAELEALNAMVHPEVARETDRILRSHEQTDSIVVHDIPLLVMPGGELLSSRDLDEWVGIIVVDADPEVACQRVIESRFMSKQDVHARQAQQATQAERVAAGDFVIDNNGTYDELLVEVEKCWNWMNASGAQRSEVELAQ